MRAAKYSSQGDRIATATWDSVRIWDSNDGRLLVEFKVTVTPWWNTGLLWFNNTFVPCDRKIKQIEASTGSTVSEWPVPDTNRTSCFALPKHGKFIAYPTQRTAEFWDTAIHTQLGLLQHPESLDVLLACAGKRRGYFVIGHCRKRRVRDATGEFVGLGRSQGSPSGTA